MKVLPAIKIKPYIWTFYLFAFGPLKFHLTQKNKTHSKNIYDWWLHTVSIEHSWNVSQRNVFNERATFVYTESNEAKEKRKMAANDDFDAMRASLKLMI